jgi:hypothetical protein
MPLEEINHCITEYEQYNFIFSDDFLAKIRNECKSWKNDWIVSFRKQLRRIKNEEGTLAHDEMDGKRVTTPLVKNRYMAIYFKPQPDGRYFIYNFILDTK